jgi:acyl-CoA synthetase (AMP-forming)/AMP-acid ligase II
MPIISRETLGGIVDHEQGVTLTPDELRAQVMRRREAYYSAGMRRGDKAIIGHGNSHQFFGDLLALWEIGVCCVPIDRQASLGEIANMADHCGAKLVVYRGDFDVEGLTSLLGADTAVFNSDDADNGNIGDEGHTFQDQQVGWEDEALILYTSGSTGQPKGVVHTVRTLIARLNMLRADVDLKEINTALTLLPTHFGHGLICNSLYPLLNGRTLVVMPAFSSSTLGELGAILDRYEVNFMSSVPTVWRIATRFSEPPKSGTLNRIHCGSAPLSANLYESIVKWTGTSNVKNTYGITEVGSWLAGTEDGVTDFVDGYIGKGWGTDIMILESGVDPSAVDPDKYELGPDAEGDIWVRTPALMAGYHKRPDLTDKVVKNTWFHTGDAGFKNKNGSLVIVGRQHNVINKAGMKIFPEDIDLALERSSAVTEACTFGIDDRIAGQVVGVAVVLSPDQDGADAAREWLSGRISPHKMPSKWFPVESLPRDSRGKLNRDKIAAFCLGKTD